MENKASATATLSNDTDFASPTRSHIDEIRHINALVESAPNIKAVMDAMPFVVLLINSNRQIVAANQKVVSLLGVDIEDALGKRPGELIGCAYAVEGPNGCGTGMHCQVCGAVNAILDCLSSDERITEECRITLGNGGALDWEVTTSPLVVEGQSLICIGIQDISHKKRRSSLERTFFHDIINQVGAISGFIKLMAEEYEDCDELNEVITLSNELLEEILSQRNLCLAENGDLEPKCEHVELTALLRRIGQLYQHHPVANEKNISIICENAPPIQTDPQLLRRILGNMLKNALEASSPGQTVTLSYEQRQAYVSIHVHNPDVIPPNVQLQIFNRSFTTKKGAGHGIGTYSMKLLGEKYLNGCVWFSSTPEGGTIFSISLPMNQGALDN